MPFTEGNIDSTQNALIKNVTTRSIVLAPFNSTMTDVFNFDESLETLPARNKQFKFKGRVKELDREYEKNNNGEVDNGVYNRDTESLLQSSRHVDDDSINDGDEIVNVCDVSQFDQINIGILLFFVNCLYRHRASQFHRRKIRIPNLLR